MRVQYLLLAIVAICTFTTVTAQFNGFTGQFSQIASESPTGTQGTPSFSKRYGIATVTRNNELLVLGGRDDKDIGVNGYSDVHVSTDGGRTWSVRTPHNPTGNYRPRRSHSAVVIPNAPVPNTIIVLGGLQQSTLNDVWQSTDGGVTWTQVCSGGVTNNCGFTARSDAVALYVPGTSPFLILIGGANDASAATNTIYRSTNNGATWTLVTPTFTTGSSSTNFYRRWMHAGTIAPNGNIIISGGQTPLVENDVWSSPNGIEWTLLSQSTGRFSRRYGHGMVTSCGYMYVIGGDNPPSTNLNDVWGSQDGVTWTQITPQAGFTTRQGFGCTQVQNTIVVIAGATVTSGGPIQSYYNDVWSSPQAQYNIGTFGTCNCVTGSAGFATQTRTVTCPSACGCQGTAPATSQTCVCYSYEIGQYGTCSVTCGTGTQTRSIVCRGTDGNTYPTSSCVPNWGQPQATQRVCNTSPCVTYSWVAGQYGTCSVTCGVGIQTRTNICRGSDGANYAATFCDGQTPLATQQACNTHPCITYQWQISPYGSCSPSCGTGIRTRSVQCLGSDGNIYLNSVCLSVPGSTPLPTSSETCNNGPCVTYSWVAGQYGQCSTSCGAGTRTRVVTCVGSNSVTYENSLCDSGTKPVSFESCNNTPCCIWQIGSYGQCSQECPINGVPGTATRSVTCRDRDTPTFQPESCCETSTVQGGGVKPVSSIPCNTFCVQITGDPEFVGFLGQKYEIHGVPNSVFNIITSPLLQYNALFSYIGSKSLHAHQCNNTRTHPWTHAGTYLGKLGFKTGGGDRIEIHSGTCLDGIKLVKVNGKILKQGQRVQLKSIEGQEQSIIYKNQFDIILHLAEVDIALTNSDNFFNQAVTMTEFGEQKLQTHGLLGQTWRDATYVTEGVRRVTEGVSTDYMIQDDDLFGNDFVYNRYQF